MDFPEAIDYLYSRLPMFQNQGDRAYKPGLMGIENLCDHLGNPHKLFKTIHVGGTNGKGSTSHMLAAVLQVAGYRVGLYTSPHLKSFTERIRIDGQEVEKSYVANFVSENQDFIEKHKPSFFEVTVAMAFDYFARAAIDIAVIEVGMGGRLDSTNIITPEVSIITNIGWDHMQYLGDTLPQIAGEKAGIIKPGVSVVISESPSQEVRQIFENKAQSMSADLTIAADQYTLIKQEITVSGQSIELVRKQDSYKHIIELDLAGSYQVENLKAVLFSLNMLDQSYFSLDPKDIVRGLSSVTSTTGLKGRWQTLQKSPLVICDTAHNLDGLKRTIAQFNLLPLHRRHFVLGFVSDKDVGSILSLLPKDAQYYFCQPSIQRAMAFQELVEIARKIGLFGQGFINVNEALSMAVANASPQDGIYVGGSTFVVADLNRL